MLPFLLACTADVLDAARIDNEDFLDDAVLSGLPERAWLDGPSDVTVGDQVLSAVSLTEAATVYEIADDHLGLVVEVAGLRLLASVDRGALRPVLVESTLAIPDPAASADGIGLRFPAGTPVDVTSAIGEAVLLNSTASWLEGSGWVSLSAVDDYAVWREPQSGWSGSIVLAADTPLLDAPSGEAFAWVSEEQWASPVGGAEDGWQRVEIARSQLSVQGYIPAQDTRAMGTASGFGFGSMSGCSHMLWTDEEPTLRAGTVLHDAPSGAAVGMVLRDRYDPILDHEDGLALFGIETPWGVVELWESD